MSRKSGSISLVLISSASFVAGCAQKEPPPPAIACDDPKGVQKAPAVPPGKAGAPNPNTPKPGCTKSQTAAARHTTRRRSSFWPWFWVWGGGTRSSYGPTYRPSSPSSSSSRPGGASSRPGSSATSRGGFGGVGHGVSGSS